MVRTLIHRLDGDVFVTGEGGAKFTLSIKIPEVDNLSTDGRGDHLIQ